MPLSFLISGYIQTIIGSGLRSGRYLSVALTPLLLGLWIASKRQGSRW